MLRRTAISFPTYIHFSWEDAQHAEQVFPHSLYLSVTGVKIRICRKKEVFLFCKKLIKY